jgi:hypothetical protein
LENNNDLTKVLKNNHENLIAQIIIEALNDSEEENYLESNGGKFWLTLADIEPRRLENALIDTEGSVNDRRYIMETLVPEAGNSHLTATSEVLWSDGLEPTTEELDAIEVDPVVIDITID